MSSIPIPWYHGMGNPYHTPLIPIPCHLVRGPFYQIWKVFLIFLSAVFFVFWIFFNENNIKQHNFNIFRKLRDRATIIVLWENWPKKEGASPIRVNDADRQHEITNTPQKSVYIPYLCLKLFVHMYLLPDSSSISFPPVSVAPNYGQLCITITLFHTVCCSQKIIMTLVYNTPIHWNTSFLQNLTWLPLSASGLTQGYTKACVEPLHPKCLFLSHIQTSTRTSEAKRQLNSPAVITCFLLLLVIGCLPCLWAVLFLYISLTDELLSGAVDAVMVASFYFIQSVTARPSAQTASTLESMMVWMILNALPALWKRVKVSPMYVFDLISFSPIFMWI